MAPSPRKRPPAGRPTTPRADADPAEASDVPHETPAETAGETAFDVWLERGLHDLYDQFAEEPVPDSLKAIIDAHRKKQP